METSGSNLNVLLLVGNLFELVLLDEVVEGWLVVLCEEFRPKNAGAGINDMVGHGWSWRKWNHMESSKFTKVAGVPIKVTRGEAHGGQSFEEKGFVAQSCFHAIDSINLDLSV